MAEDCARYQVASHIRKWPDLSLDTPSGQTTLQTHATQQRLATVALATVQQVCKGRPTNITPTRAHTMAVLSTSFRQARLRFSPTAPYNTKCDPPSPIAPWSPSSGEREGAVLAAVGILPSRRHSANCIVALRRCRLLHSTRSLNV
ncbi:hypothetical protein Bpfe_011226 [Biomphalaria pfeifferi]|uniref:Uncharacterized protein n=1 Tax=Biomphalaria pfeifferi TaxID=112525 RepID=A0AAD8BRA9_BIOPF|nr:hypothetical protein Bpfe_011226 [Biomphalaria pfeifferi]